MVLLPWAGTCSGHEYRSLSCLHAGSPGIAAYDEKNIRRRVYDALNVLMAMDIIIKDKKEISWQGLPTAPARAAGEAQGGARRPAPEASSTSRPTCRCAPVCFEPC